MSLSINTQAALFTRFTRDTPPKPLTDKELSRKLSNIGLEYGLRALRSSTSQTKTGEVSEAIKSAIQESQLASHLNATNRRQALIKVLEATTPLCFCSMVKDQLEALSNSDFYKAPNVAQLTLAIQSFFTTKQNYITSVLESLVRNLSYLQPREYDPLRYSTPRLTAAVKAVLDIEQAAIAATPDASTLLKHISSDSSAVDFIGPLSHVCTLLETDLSGERIKSLLDVLKRKRKFENDLYPSRWTGQKELDALLDHINHNIRSLKEVIENLGTTDPDVLSQLKDLSIRMQELNRALPFAARLYQNIWHPEYGLRHMVNKSSEKLLQNLHESYQTCVKSGDIETLTPQVKEFLIDYFCCKKENCSEDYMEKKALKLIVLKELPNDNGAYPTWLFKQLVQFIYPAIFTLDAVTTPVKTEKSTPAPAPLSSQGIQPPVPAIDMLLSWNTPVPLSSLPTHLAQPVALPLTSTLAAPWPVPSWSPHLFLEENDAKAQPFHDFSR
jgi:hypothetical protein